jgi:hypothetical protein
MSSRDGIAASVTAHFRAHRASIKSSASRFRARPSVAKTFEVLGDMHVASTSAAPAATRKALRGEQSFAEEGSPL